MYNTCQFHCQPTAISVGLLGYFVTYAPDHYAGMVAVAQYLVFQVTLMPLIKKQMIIKFGFATLPAVKRFVHNNKAHFIGKLKQFRRVATRYDKLLANFLGFVKIAAIAIWIR